LTNNRLFLDIDSGVGWLWRLNDPLWDDLLPLVRMEGDRLRDQYPLGDRYVIKRSDNGWHLKFPRASLPKETEKAIMWGSQTHFGHKFFSQEINDTTLRVEAKPFKGSIPPRFVEMVVKPSND